MNDRHLSGRRFRDDNKKTAPERGF